MNKKNYWKKNIQYLSILLTIWFVIGTLCSLVFVNELNSIKIGGFPLGFWFAMQGAQITFVVIIFLYVRWMNKLDEEYGVKD